MAKEIIDRPEQEKPAVGCIQLFSGQELMPVERAKEIKLTLQLFYKEYVKQWKEYRLENLGKDFSLCQKRVNRDVVNGIDNQYALAQFSYLSNYGLISINIYSIDYSKNIIIVSTDLYTQGYSGEEKGNGKRGYQEMEKILKIMSAKLQCQIYDIAIPHKKSIGLLVDNGYQTFSKNVFEKIKPNFVNFNGKENIYGFLEDYQKYLKLIKEYKLQDIDLAEVDQRSLSDAEAVDRAIATIVGS